MYGTFPLRNAVMNSNECKQFPLSCENRFLMCLLFWKFIDNATRPNTFDVDYRTICFSTVQNFMLECNAGANAQISMQFLNEWVFQSKIAKYFFIIEETIKIAYLPCSQTENGNFSSIVQLDGRDFASHFKDRSIPHKNEMKLSLLQQSRLVWSGKKTNHTCVVRVRASSG